MTKKGRYKSREIEEVAREAGVSRITAYRAVNAPQSVAGETREKVLRALARRNVSISKRNTESRGSAVRRSLKRIAFLAPFIPEDRENALKPTVSAISEEMVQGILETCQGRDAELILQHYTWQGEGSLTFPAELSERSFDGILLRPPPDRHLVADFCRGRKVVLLGNGFVDGELPSVTVDDGTGIDLAVDYLHGLGHRNIALVSLAPRALIYRRRLDTYASSLHRLGLAINPSYIKLHDSWIVLPDEQRSLCRRFLDELMALDQPPTAIVATSDSFASGLIMAARERGLSVPRDLSITGFSNLALAAHTHPPLSTVHVDNRAIGRLGALQLLQMLDGADLTGVNLTVRPRFVERTSCSAPRKKAAPRARARSRAFTLLELLAVIAITLLLVILSVPAAGRFLESGRTSKCTANLRQIYAASQSYSVDHEASILPLVNQSSGYPLIWSTILVLDGYLPADPAMAPSPINTALSCPTAKTLSPKPAIHETYGINAFVAPIINGDSVVMASAARKIGEIPNPASRIFFSDALDNVIALEANEPTKKGCPDYRHNNAAHLLFFDGHIEKCIKGQLPPPGITPSYDKSTPPASPW